LDHIECRIHQKVESIMDEDLTTDRDENSTISSQNFQKSSMKLTETNLTNKIHIIFIPMNQFPLWIMNSQLWLDQSLQRKSEVVRRNQICFNDSNAHFFCIKYYSCIRYPIFGIVDRRINEEYTMNWELSVLR
jgi:hypothetical protein